MVVPAARTAKRADARLRLGDDRRAPVLGGDSEAGMRRRRRAQERECERRAERDAGRADEERELIAARQRVGQRVAGG